MDAMPSGSYLLISCGFADETGGAAFGREYTAASFRNHTPGQIRGFSSALSWSIRRA